MAQKTKKTTTEKKELVEEVAIPENIQLSINGTVISVKGPKGEIKRDLAYYNAAVEKTDKKLIIKSARSDKKTRAVVGAFVAHLNNMLQGVTTGFKYKLKIVFSHFPITAKVIGDNVEITNFMGEKLPRRAKIFGKVKVTATKDEIVVEGVNVEEVGQTMANIEQATRVKYRDQRIFQDGIYLVERA